MVHLPPATFRYYQAVITGLQPSGGFVDGGTVVTLTGHGFDGFNGIANNTLASFGGIAQTVISVSPTSVVVQTPAFSQGAGGGMVVELGLSLNGIDFEMASSGVAYRYYEHRTVRLEPSGGPSIGGSVVSIIGLGFSAYDGQLASARCSFGGVVVGVEALQDDFIACLSPQMITGQLEATTNAGANATDSASQANSSHASVAVGAIDTPESDATYEWSDGQTTSERTVFATLLKVAVNAIDFRGQLSFRFYHQVMSNIRCTNSNEFGMTASEGTISEFAGGSPGGGYSITLVGSGFDGYDRNPSTVRVRFATELANGEADREINRTRTQPVVATIEVPAISMTGTQIVVRAPAVSLSEGDIISTRGFPCWQPPCRRTVVTAAVNGVDFVGRAQPLVFYFFNEPWRFLGLMETELILVVGVLLALSLINGILTWHYRFEVYDRYLRIKYRLKNRIIFPIIFRHVRIQ